MGNRYLKKPTHKGYKPVKLICDFCRTIFWESKSSAEKKIRHFCSNDCYSNFRKEYLSKEEHNRYGTGFDIQEVFKRKTARATLNHAIRDGKIIRKDCEVCKKKAEAHHNNYEKPLEIRWLCFKHHRKFHKENPELLEDKEKNKFVRVSYIDSDGHISGSGREMSIEQFRLKKLARISQGKNLTLMEDEPTSLDFHT